MNNQCNKCGLCCKIIPACQENSLRDGIKPLEDFFQPLNTDAALSINESFVRKIQEIFPQVEFYTCKYLSTKNQCINPNPPENCKTFPNSPLAIVSDDCTYYGEIFIKNEELKQKIRKIKEEIVHYEALISSNHKDKTSYQKIIKNQQSYIKRFEKYGSTNW